MKPNPPKMIRIITIRFIMGSEAKQERESENKENPALQKAEIE